MPEYIFEVWKLTLSSKKYVIITLWKVLKFQLSMAKYHCLKSVPPVHEFMSPTIRQREIIQGKVVQIGSYPTDWSQYNPPEVTAQVQPQLRGKYGYQSALWRAWVSLGRTNWEDCFCVLSYCCCFLSGEEA